MTMLDQIQPYEPAIELLANWLCENRPFKGYEQFARDFAPLVHTMEHRRRTAYDAFEGLGGLEYGSGLYINHGPCLSTLVPFRPFDYVGKSFPFRHRRVYQPRDALFCWEGEDDAGFQLLASHTFLQGRDVDFKSRRIPSNAERLETWLRQHKDCANVTDDEGWVVGEFTRGPAGSDRFYFRIVC